MNKNRIMADGFHSESISWLEDRIAELSLLTPGDRDYSSAQKILTQYRSTLTTMRTTQGQLFDAVMLDLSLLGDT